MKGALETIPVGCMALCLDCKKANQSYEVRLTCREHATGDEGSPCQSMQSPRSANEEYWVKRGESGLCVSHARCILVRKTTLANYNAGIPA